MKKFPIIDKKKKVLIFIGEKEKIKEKKLLAYSRSIGNKIYISFQENAWADAEIFLKWLKTIFLIIE